MPSTNLPVPLSQKFAAVTRGDMRQLDRQQRQSTVALARHQIQTNEQLDKTVQTLDAVQEAALHALSGQMSFYDLAQAMAGGSFGKRELAARKMDWLSQAQIEVIRRAFLTGR